MRKRRTQGVTFFERTLTAPQGVLDRLRGLCLRQHVDRSPQVVGALTEILDQPDEPYIVQHKECTDRMTVSIDGALDGRLKDACGRFDCSRQQLLRTALVRACENLERQQVAA